MEIQQQNQKQHPATASSSTSQDNQMAPNLNTEDKENGGSNSAANAQKA